MEDELKGPEMKSRVCLTILVVLGVAAMLYSAAQFGVTGLATASATAAEDDDKKKDGPPPLVIDKNAPLLLDAPPKQQPASAWDPFGTPAGPVADNSVCLCCHANYEEEPFAVTHAKQNISCIKCHGESIEHRNDEDNVTPPDKIFAPEKIEKVCDRCHDEHDVPATKVVARWLERCPEKKDAKKVVCTDCHGQHRLKIRTVRWDKNTRKLIVTDPQEGKEDADKKEGCKNEEKPAAKEQGEAACCEKDKKPEASAKTAKPCDETAGKQAVKK